MEKTPCTYFMANKRNTVLYCGSANDLVKRVWEHKNNVVKGFTQRYNIHKLVYYEMFETVEDVIKREQQFKGWSRKKKIKLIEQMNPTWRDLYEDIV